MHAEVGATDGADLDAAMDMDTFFALASGELEPRAALSKRRVRLVAGEPGALERFFTVFSLATRVATAA
jgi:hypothetical protein